MDQVGVFCLGGVESDAVGCLRVKATYLSNSGCFDVGLTGERVIDKFQLKYLHELWHPFVSISSCRETKGASGIQRTNNHFPTNDWYIPQPPFKVKGNIYDTS